MKQLQSQLSWFSLIVFSMALVLVVGFSVTQTRAQNDDPPPVVYTPGAPLQILTPTLSPDTCYPAFNLEAGDYIYIKPGVIIRNQPSRSGALVWNTIFDSRDEDGRVEDNPILVPATIAEGPVCAQGYNWWRVIGTGNPGWVAEGRPDDGGYFIIPPPDVAAGLICPPLNDFTIGEDAELRFNVRIRENPSLEGRTKTIAPAGTPIRIIGAGQCVDGIVWWGVRATVVDFTYEGWMAQGVGDEDFELDYLVPEDAPSLADGTLCAPPLPFSEGMQGYVNYYNGGPKSLRSAPGTESTLLFSLVDGVPFIIAGGPICRENLNWWQITVRSTVPVTGWMAEGSPGEGVGYWMSRQAP